MTTALSKVRSALVFLAAARSAPQLSSPPSSPGCCSSPPSSAERPPLDGAPPREPDTEALLAELDRYRHARGTLPLFDALLEEDPARIALALQRAPLHPTRPLVLHWLQHRGYPLPALPSPDALLLAEIDARLQEQERQVALLSRRVEALDNLNLAARRVNEVYAVVCVLCVGAAILGWMSALGLLPIAAEVPTPLVPALPDPPGGSP